MEQIPELRLPLLFSMSEPTNRFRCCWRNEDDFPQRPKKEHFFTYWWKGALFLVCKNRGGKSSFKIPVKTGGLDMSNWCTFYQHILHIVVAICAWFMDTQNMRNSVAIYTRVSTNDQTTIQQEEELKKYCSMRGWDNITIYSDKVSGAKSLVQSLHEKAWMKWWPR